MKGIIHRYSLTLRVLLALWFIPLATFANTPNFLATDSTVKLWDIIELSVYDNSTYSNPFWDAVISAQFTGPGNNNYTVSGVYYDSATWKVRFAPTDTGLWTYTLSFSGASGTSHSSGTFMCLPPDSGDHGFINVNLQYPHTLVTSDGSTFMPLGIDGYTPAIGAAFLGIAPVPPQSQVPNFWDTLAFYHINTIRVMMFHQPAFPNSFSWNTYEGNANLVYNTSSLDRYDSVSLKLMDEWFNAAKSHHIYIYLCTMTLYDLPAYPFTSSPWSTSLGGPYTQLNDMYQLTSGAGFDYEMKYFSYLANRWSAYDNLVSWEYNNEYGSICSPQWIEAIDSVLHANDPYRRPHSVSFWNYTFSDTCVIDSTPAVDLTDDHFYEFNGFNVYDGDSGANAQAVSRYFQFGKPVMFGEFGSGAGSDSADDFTFQRVAYWGALTGGGYPLYWLSGNNDSTGWSYDIATLRFIKVVNGIVCRLPDFNTMQPANTDVNSSQPDSVRAYCLSGYSSKLVYVHHYTSHSTTISGLTLMLSFPGYLSYSYQGTWLDASTGDSIGSISGNSATGTSITAPDFIVDEVLVLRLSNIVTNIQNVSAQVSSAVGNYPNPFTDETSFTIQLRNGGGVEIKIYDELGNVVDKPIQKICIPGTNTITWKLNSEIALGTYYALISSPDGTMPLKIVKID